jgi:hypothetical protein
MNISELEALAAQGDPYARADAARYLGEMGSAGVPLLLRLLSDADSMVRFRAASALGAIGRDAIDALPALEELLQDENPQVQREARRVIGTILDVQDVQKVARHPLLPEGSDDQWYLLAVAHTGQLFLESHTVWVHERGAVEREPTRLWTLQEAEALVPDQIPRTVWEKAAAKARQIQESSPRPAS